MKPVPSQPGDFPASAQDLSYPLIVCNDCNRVSVKFSIFHGQNCMFAMEADNPSFSNLVFHGNNVILYGYNMDDPLHSDSVFYFNKISGSFTDNVCVRLLGTKPSGETINLLNVVDCTLSKRFNVITFPSIGPQNYVCGTPYWLWGSPAFESTLWFGRRYSKIQRK